MRPNCLGLAETIKLHLMEKGELAEWLKAHAWKACIPQKGIGGSNPSFSAFLCE